MLGDTDPRHFGAFRHQRLGTIMKISTKLQKCICLTSTLLRSRFGDEKRVAEKVRSRQLEGLSHLARMPDTPYSKASFA